MRPMDTPPRRPLGDEGDPADQARARPGVPDGRARPPAELLDNLRLRLSELPANHPSAPSAEGRRAAPGGAGRASSDAAPARAVERDDAVPAHAAPDQAPAGHGGGRGRDHARGEPASAAKAGAAGEADPPGSEAGEAAAGGILGDALRTPRLTGDAPAGAGDAVLGAPGRAGPGEAYRPWFMSGEPGIPWWAGDDLWERC